MSIDWASVRDVITEAVQAIRDVQERLLGEGQEVK